MACGASSSCVPCLALGRAGVWASEGPVARRCCGHCTAPPSTSRAVADLAWAYMAWGEAIQRKLHTEEKEEEERGWGVGTITSTVLNHTIALNPAASRAV